MEKTEKKQVGRTVPKSDTMSSNRNHFTFSTSRHFKIASWCSVYPIQQARDGAPPLTPAIKPFTIISNRHNSFSKSIMPISCYISARLKFPAFFNSLQPLTVPIFHGTGYNLHHVLTILRFRRTFSLSTSTPTGCGFPTSPAVCKLHFGLWLGLLYFLPCRNIFLVQRSFSFFNFNIFY